MIKEFLKPASVEEAVSLKKKSGSKACYFGGGSRINTSAHDFEVAISLEALNLNKIENGQNELVIGSQVTLQQLIDASDVAADIKDAAAHMASRNNRNLSTVGGDIASNIIDSVLIPCFMANSAILVTAEEGEISVDDYISQKKSSLILNVKVPKSDRKIAVKKVAIQSHAIPVISVAIGASLNSGKVSDAVVALSGLKDGVARLSAVENAWMSGTDKDTMEKIVAEAVQFNADLQGSVEYKTYVAGVTIADLIDELK